MKTAFRNQHQQVEIRDITPRPLRDTEVRIAVEACGICGTDLHGGTPEGEIFGHEVAGKIIELGAAVRGFEAGQRVVLESSSFCGQCDDCRNAKVEFCSHIVSFFHIRNSSLGFAENMIAPMESIIPYEGLTPEVACLQEPLGVALDLVRVSDIKPGQRVLLIGAGPIGLMAMEVIKNTVGVKNFYVSDFKKQQGRYQLAQQIGFDAWIEPGDLAGFDFGGPVDRILVTAPPAAIPAALKLGGLGSRISYIGIGWTPERSNQLIDLDAMHFKKQALTPSYAAPALFGPQALDYLKRGIVKGDRYISHRFALDNLNEAVKTAKSSDAVKVIVTP